MPSPFPGMNPYLEQEEVWQDFHDSFVPAIRDALSPQLSPHFIVKIEEALYLHEPSAEERLRAGKADVGIARAKQTGDSEAGVATVEAPEHILLPLQVEIEKHLFLEVRDRKSRELVTVIELLSPSNKKSGADREQYLAKRRSLLRSTAHFVEIDLLRGWSRMPFEEELAPCDYCIIVSEVAGRPRAGIWRLGLRDRLPSIPIPLRPPVPKVRLDLQDVLHTVYDRAYYKDYIYQSQPNPPLSPEDAAWAAAILGN